jgi:hypothetical protein
VFNLSQPNSSDSKFAYSGKVSIEENGSGMNSQSWSDFVAALATQVKSSGALRNRMVTWNVGDDGKLIPNNDQSIRTINAPIATYVLTPDQHIILKGKVNNEKLEAIQRANNLDELIQTSAKFDLQPFLSRPGSGTILALKADIGPGV